mgnify:FL=1
MSAMTLDTLAERLDRLEKLLLAGVVWRKYERST